LRLRPRILLQQKIDQFEARLASILIGIARPSAVDGVVIVAKRVVGGSSPSRQARERQIDRAVLRGRVPQVQQVCLRLIVPARFPQRAGQIQLLFRIVPVVHQGGAEVVERKFRPARLHFREPGLVRVPGNSFFVGLEPSHEPRNCGEAGIAINISVAKTNGVRRASGLGAVSFIAAWSSIVKDENKTWEGGPVRRPGAS